MFVKIRLDDFSILHQDASVSSQNHKLRIANGKIPNVINADTLRNTEYLQYAEIDLKNREVLFGRDYLGLFPLYYSLTKHHLMISDSINKIISERKKDNEYPSINKQSIALYFAMGYIPQGRSIYENIILCENASYYRYSANKVIKHSIFKAIEIENNLTEQHLKEVIDDEINNTVKHHHKVDIWCSGGLDSSAVAISAKEYTTSTRLLTLSYPDNVISEHGEGELNFTRILAEHMNEEMSVVKMTDDVYTRNFNRFITHFPAPVIDICVVPKFCLAESSNHITLTGEGGDPLFSGVKNNALLFLAQQNPAHALGWLYAYSHNRFAARFSALFDDSETYTEFVTQYLNQQLGQFPGDIVRKLFYANTFLKQGSLIFLESYYARKNKSAIIKHPLTSNNVYQTAFSLRDETKYCYPHGKLALLKIYQNRLPQAIIKRKKSGTLLPLQYYTALLENSENWIENLYKTGIIKESFLNTGEWQNNRLLHHALFVLSQWIEHHE